MSGGNGKLRGASLIATALALAASGCGGDSDDEPQADEPAEEQALLEAIPADGAPSVTLEDREIRRLDISTPDWMVSAFGSLWVKRDTGEVVRVDPANGKVIAEVTGTGKPDPHGCQGLGASEDSIWSCPRVGAIERIDPETNSVTATIRVEKILDQGRLVSAADQLWLITDDGNSLTAIDHKTNKRTDPVALPGECVDLAAADPTLWVTCPQEDLLLQVDAETGEITGELELAGAQNAAAGDHLWVGFEGGLAQIDPATLEVIAVYGVYPRLGGAIFPTPDAVWVREEDDERFLTHIDPVEQEIVETIEPPPDLTSGGDVVVIDESVWTTAYNDETLVEVRASD